jgi:hypothetical protein
MAEMAPEPRHVPPDSSHPEPDEGSDEYLAKQFPDLYEAALAGRPAYKQLVQAWYLAVDREHEGDARAGGWLLSRLRQRFAEHHEGIEKEYYCVNLVGGCLLASDRTVHSIFNSAPTALVTQEIDCKILAREACVALGTSKLKPQLDEATDHAYSALTRVLGAADQLAAIQPPDEAAQSRILEAASAEVNTAKLRVAILIQRQSRYEYFVGSLLGTLPTLCLVALLTLVTNQFWSSKVDIASLAGAMTMATLGGLISVVQRMSVGDLVVDSTASTRQRMLLGGLRPAVGAIFGSVAYFALLTGIVASGATASSTEPSSLAFFALTGFAAGFSERFATDMLERAGTLLGNGPLGNEPTSPSRQP